MGIGDLFKATENENLKKKIQEDKNLIKELRKNIYKIASINNKLQQALGSDYQTVIDFQNKIDDLDKKTYQLGIDYDNKRNEINQRISELDKTKNNLENDIKLLKSSLINLKEEELYQSFGIYQPIYDFANSEQYKNKLESVRQEQKNMVKKGTATTLTTKNHSTFEEHLIKDNIKLLIRSFNSECELTIDKVKFNNVDTMRSKILKSYEQLNKLTSKLDLSITIKYLNLKLDELSLSYEYQLKKQEEKEHQKIIREELREQARVEKELEDARKNTIKDKQHYEKAINDIDKRLENITNDEEKQNLIAKKGLLEVELDNINSKLKDIDYRQKNQKAGYVYIISNIGSFGENIYKIGMTRRLEPEERIHELSDASVPFNFDIHAMIFTEDAPALENTLHKAFEDKKVNMINQRREFFNVTLNEIKEVVKNNFDKSVEFIDIAPAEQYRETENLKKSITK